MLERVGKVDDVSPGAMRAVNVGRRTVAIANVDGVLYAFDDVCTHQGCSLAEGDLEGTTVTCACHGSEFDVRTGEVLEGPADEPVATYEVVVEGDEVTIRR